MKNEPKNPFSIGDASVTAPAPTNSWVRAIAPYLQKEPIAAFLLGVSSGFPYAMIGATLTTRLAQDGIDKKTITAFTLAFLVYNFKVFWAWMVDSVRLPLLHSLGQRRSWMLLAAVLVTLAVWALAAVDPKANLDSTIAAAIFVGFAGATFDIVIDAYRIETLKPQQLGTGSGMCQYGWRIGSASAGALALLVAGKTNWQIGYALCAIFALPALLACYLCGEPVQRAVSHARRSVREIVDSIYAPFVEFFARPGALLVIAFILLHKIGDTIANLTFRLLFNDMGYSNAEIATYDVGIGFWAYLIGIFVGGVLYAKVRLQNSVLTALVLMCISNLSFALLAAHGHSNWGMAAAITFENIASGLGGVVLIAYFSALCNLRYTASQYALISAAASIVGRVLTGTTAGALIESLGFVPFYGFTAVLALPGIILFTVLIRRGFVDALERERAQAN
jgi:MFS transporter, PAT family, beta-lactamase induction signal transducer AmpG